MNFIECFEIDPYICDVLVDEFNRSEKHEGTIAVPGKDGLVISEKVSSETKLNINSLGFKLYTSALQNCLNLYIKKYPYCNFYSPFSITENIKLQKYPKNKGYLEFHTERGSLGYPNCSRHLVFMTYLNTVYNGGGTEFFHQRTTISAEKGKTLIWPADWTHTHRGVAAPDEEKIIVTGWYNFTN